MTKNIQYSLLFATVLISFGVVFSAFAIDTTQPNGALKWGSYTNWLQNALEVSPTDRGEALSGEVVVKQANTLADEKGQSLLLENNGNLGLGISTPQGLLDIRGTRASIKIKTSSAVVRLLLNTGGFQVNSSGTMELFMGDTVLSLLTSAIDSSKNITIGGVNVVLSSQTCPSGEKITGTDSDGDIICQPYAGVSLPECNFNNFLLTRDKSPVDYCTMADQIYCILHFKGNKRLDGRCHFDDGS